MKINRNKIFWINLAIFWVCFIIYQRIDIFNPILVNIGFVGWSGLLFCFLHWGDLRQWRETRKWEINPETGLWFWLPIKASGQIDQECLNNDREYWTPFQEKEWEIIVKKFSYSTLNVDRIVDFSDLIEHPSLETAMRKKYLDEDPTLIDRWMVEVNRKQNNE